MSNSTAISKERRGQSRQKIRKLFEESSDSGGPTNFMSHAANASVGVNFAVDPC
jgi:hypothetical protein